MEWTDYLRNITNRKITVDGLLGENSLSPQECKALLSVFPTQYDILSFVKAGKSIHKSGKTLTTQFQSIYYKFTIEPATPKQVTVPSSNEN